MNYYLRACDKKFKSSVKRWLINERPNSVIRSDLDFSRDQNLSFFKCLSLEDKMYPVAAFCLSSNKSIYAKTCFYILDEDLNRLIEYEKNFIFNPDPINICALSGGGELHYILGPVDNENDQIQCARIIKITLDDDARYIETTKNQIDELIKTHYEQNKIDLEILASKDAIFSEFCRIAEDLKFTDENIANYQKAARDAFKIVVNEKSEDINKLIAEGSEYLDEYLL